MTVKRIVIAMIVSSISERIQLLNVHLINARPWRNSTKKQPSEIMMNAFVIIFVSINVVKYDGDLSVAWLSLFCIVFLTSVLLQYYWEAKLGWSDRWRSTELLFSSRTLQSCLLESSSSFAFSFPAFVWGVFLASLMSVLDRSSLLGIHGSTWRRFHCRRSRSILRRRQGLCSVCSKMVGRWLYVQHQDQAFRTVVYFLSLSLSLGSVRRLKASNNYVSDDLDQLLCQSVFSRAKLGKQRCSGWRRRSHRSLSTARSRR